jgi:hypothetical protein
VVRRSVRLWRSILWTMPSMYWHETGVWICMVTTYEGHGVNGCDPRASVSRPSLNHTLPWAKSISRANLRLRNRGGIPAHQRGCSRGSCHTDANWLKTCQCSNVP